MRRFVLILMLVLLPLRGWAGSVMAVEMSAQNFNAINLEAEYDYSTRASGHFDEESAAQSHAGCPGHAEMALGASSHSPDGQETTANGHCGSCGVCQICHSFALANTVALAPALLPSPSFFAATGFSFASASLASSLKPPIS